MTLTERVNPGFYFYNGQTAIYPVGEADKETFLQKPIGLGRTSSSSMSRDRASSPSAGRSSTSPGMPYADQVVISIMGEAPARCRVPQQGDRHVDPRAGAICRLPEDPNLQKGILEVAEVFTRHMGMNPEYKPFSDKRVRQAINHAIDTDLIIKRLVKDKAYRATAGCR